jgi:hypothetical protein
MAYFEGTINEFMKFLGAYARIKVMFLTTKYRKGVGKCENCGSSNGLEAAHVRGKERPLLIKNVLSEFIDGDTIKVDLTEFEQRFELIHQPIEKTFKILCRKCHREYDNAPDDITMDESVVIAEDKKDANVVEQLIDKDMNKSKAIQLINRKHPGVNGNTTTYSNIIPALESWWFQISNDKFKSDFYFVLHNDKSKQLFVLKVPANTIKTPGTYFNQRNDKYRKDTSNIYIPTSGTSFKEKNGFDFTSFLIENISY